MVDIIRINNDPHTETQRLLPWYVNGTLEGDELDQVERHLAECAECREDLDTESSLAWELKELPGAGDQGWASLKARLAPPEPRKASLFSRQVPVGWAMAASLAVLVPALAFALLATVAPHRPTALYQTLGSAPTAASGNLVVIFKPDSPEASLRAILIQNRARIVDGPTSTNAYVLHVAADRRADVLARLQSDVHISLAQAIDGDTH